MQQLKDQLQALPKIELHVHLEACISLGTLQYLAKKNNINIPKHLSQGDNISFRNFDEFVQTFYAICNVITEESDFKFLAKDLIDYVKRNNIIYCEVSFTPIIYLNKGFSFFKIMEILNNEIAFNGLSGVIYFIIDTQRDHGLGIGEMVFNKVLQTKNANIVGIGMTGLEIGYNSADYTNLYRKMYDAGYGGTVHAGEYGGAAAVWTCLNDLKVKRIGHGIQSITDDKLMNYIKEHNIHLEVSPTSNVRLCRTDSYAKHPIKKFIEMGINLGINSDDPGIFNTDLTDEYVNLLTTFNFDTGVLKQCNINAANAAFAPVEKKQYLLTTINHLW